MQSLEDGVCDRFPQRLRMRWRSRFFRITIHQTNDAASNKRNMRKRIVVTDELFQSKRSQWKEFQKKIPTHHKARGSAADADAAAGPK